MVLFKSIGLYNYAKQYLQVIYCSYITCDNELTTAEIAIKQQKRKEDVVNEKANESS